jgi:hypothetical protein
MSKATHHTSHRSRCRTDRTSRWEPFNKAQRSSHLALLGQRNSVLVGENTFVSCRLEDHSGVAGESGSDVVSARTRNPRRRSSCSDRLNLCGSDAMASLAAAHACIQMNVQELRSPTKQAHDPNQRCLSKIRFAKFAKNPTTRTAAALA